MKTAGLAHLPVSYVNAALKADNHLITLDPFPVHADPTIVPYNNTNPGMWVISYFNYFNFFESRGP